VANNYHHGDLRAALVTAGLDLTRTGGPAALSIREATRQAGVSPNAAYRHFADRAALLDAVSAAIQDQMAALMVAPAARGGTAGSRARARLRAVGIGYIDFALAEPGWFAVAFFGAADDGPIDENRLPPPYMALQEALDGLVQAGVLTTRQRDGAQWPCWSTVHGFAVLALQGPLRGMPGDELRAAAARAVDAIITGVTTNPG